MISGILCLMLMAVASPVWSQQQTETSQSSDPKEEEKPSITGKVLRADTDQPLNKVKLTLQSVTDGRSYSGETQNDGTFQLTNFEPGMYWLSAERTGFIRQELGARRPGESRTGTVLDLRARAAPPSAIVIKLARGGIVGGKVVDEDGDPIAHASVQLMRYRYFRGRRALIPLSNPWGAMTNELGEYKIGDIPPGDYYISAVVRQFARPSSTSNTTSSNSTSSATPSNSTSSATPSPSNSTSNATPSPSSSTSNATAQKAFVPAYYPSASRPQDSTLVSITSGAELLRLDIQLAQARTFRVKGKVSQVEGENIMVALTTDGELPVGLFNTQYFPVRPGGAFEFSGVFPGDYVLVAQGAQDGQPRSARQLVHVIDTNVDDVLLMASGSVAVTGKLTLETDQPSSTDAPPKMPSGIRVILSSADNPFIPEVSDTVSDDGAFSFKNLGLNRYEVRVSGLPSNYWLKSIRTTRADIPDRILDLTSGATSTKLLLSAAPDAGVVSGRALNADGDPVGGATVVLVPSVEAPASSLFQVTRSAKGGVFNFSNVPPGDYYVLAWDDIEPEAYLDPEFRKRFSSNKAEVTGKKAARVTVDVTVVAQR